MQLQIGYTNDPHLMARRNGFKRIRGYFGFQFSWKHVALFIIFHWRKPWSAVFRTTPW